MKKAGATILQVIVFGVVYYLMSFIVSFILTFLNDTIFSASFLKRGIYSGIKDTVYYTFSPLAIVYVVMSAEMFVIKHTKQLFTKAAFIIIAIYMVIEVIFGIVNIASVNGIISWRMVNQIWYYIFLCGGFYYMYKLLKDDKSIENED